MQQNLKPAFNNKAEDLKFAITQLYEKEGHSINYISELLQIDSNELINKIKEWNLNESKARRHLKPSEEKFLQRNKQIIKSRLDNNEKINKIANDLHVDRKKLINIYIKSNTVLSKAYDDYIIRNDNLNTLKPEKYIEDIPGEIWKPILGYENYKVSNMGRIISKRGNNYYFVQAKEVNNSLYVRLTNNDKKSKNLQLCNIVINTFTNSTKQDGFKIHYRDNDFNNCKLDNLFWKQDKDNTALNKNIKFKGIILYKDKYEFKSLRAFAKFTNKTLPEAQEYVRNPKNKDIKIIR